MRDIPTSPRIIKLRRNRRVRMLRLAVLFFVLFISIVSALAFFSGNKHVVIDKIIISGTQIIDQGDIESEVKKDISGKYFHLFYKSNSFIYPDKKIYNNLLLNFPRIESLSIYRENLKTLHVKIIERTSSSLYCGSNMPLNKEEIGENCYFINNDGFIFDEAPYFSGNVYFKYYGIIEGGAVNPLGKQMINTGRFHELNRFIDNITSLGFKPIYIVLDQDNTNYLYLSNRASNNVPKIIFKDDNDLDVIYDNFSLAMQKEEFAEEINSKYNTLLYIDLKFDNKVLYKFQ